MFKVAEHSFSGRSAVLHNAARLFRNENKHGGHGASPARKMWFRVLNILKMGKTVASE